MPAAPATAAAAQRHWGPGPVYCFVGEKAPAGVPATTAAGARAPQGVPAVAAAGRVTVKMPPRVAGQIAGDAAALAGSTATATQLTNLILTVISAALQGILKQNASGGEGVDVEVDEGV